MTACRIAAARFRWFVATFLLISSCFSAATVAAAEVRTGVLGSGTTWETPWRVVESGNPGPTVLVIGGVHGNEPAGYRAAEQIAHWPIVRGRLVVLPRVNRLGIAANMRWFPDFRNDRNRRDLNRNFPKSDRPAAMTPLCQAVWQFIKTNDPDWVFDLHEGFDFHGLNAKSVGSSVITFPAQADFGKLLQESVNVNAEHHFDLLAKSGPVQGSLTRACSEQLGAQSFILETTFKNQDISLRTRQHRRMVSTAFQRIGLIETDCVDLLAPQRASDITRIALFDDDGANEANVLHVLDRQADLFVSHVGRNDMRPGVLRHFDLIIFPGGSGSKQGNAIGSVGRDHVRQFTREGGGVVGICAGAYLCTSHYHWSLDLMNAAAFNETVEIAGKGRKSMWYRGPAVDVDVEVTDEGAKVLGIVGLHSIRYQNGPILSVGNDPQLPAYKPLAFFRSENGIYEPQKHTMIDAPAVVTSRFGSGRVLAISPHFETTKGQESVLLRCVEHVRRQTSH